MTSEILAIMILTGGILGLVGFIISLVCVAMVAGFLRSTHKVQYVPMTEESAEETPMKEESEEMEELKKIGRKPRISEADQVITELNKSDVLY